MENSFKPGAGFIPSVRQRLPRFRPSTTAIKIHAAVQLLNVEIQIKPFWFAKFFLFSVFRHVLNHRDPEILKNVSCGRLFPGLTEERGLSRRPVAGYSIRKKAAPTSRRHHQRLQPKPLHVMQEDLRSPETACRVTSKCTCRLTKRATSAAKARPTGHASKATRR
eukprot:TRINITY_DN11161_c0_g3_i1.p1 TRINITY_DN11161_c0_g3~~TRINITY_DN11161_c0_g3_i1.p1  ORF type:complete len:165 (+),score=10.58 TRINITY_DN11161_c0_g3_i1:340-834(+)